MRRRNVARLHEGIETLNAQSRAPKTERTLSRGNESCSNREPLHVCRGCKRCCDGVVEESRSNMISPRFMLCLLLTRSAAPEAGLAAVCVELDVVYLVVCMKPFQPIPVDA
jgi:hypothetical protein